MRPIRLLTWPDYIDPETLDEFRTETEIRVDLEIVPSAAELVARMQRQPSGVDVLCPPDYAVRELESQRRLMELDHAQLPNLVHLLDRFRLGRAHDPESRVSIPKDWGTTGILWRTDQVQHPPASWKDFWLLAARHHGKLTVLDSPAEVIGAALKLRGHSYNASGAAELAVARTDLMDLRAHLLAFETDYKPLMASGRVLLALGWNGDAAALRSQGVPVNYVIPAEGSQIWEDDWAISADCTAPESAHSFLDYVLRPQVAAREARYTRYATPNRSALALLDPAMRDDSSTYPPDELLRRLEAGIPLDEAGQLRRTELWREVRG